MKRRITGAILALLAANPFCCCLGMGHSVASAQGESHPCCLPDAAPIADRGRTPSEDQEPCDCETSGRRVALLPDGDLVKNAVSPSLIELTGANDFGRHSEIGLSRGRSGGLGILGIEHPPGLQAAAWLCVFRL